MWQNSLESSFHLSVDYPPKYGDSNKYVWKIDSKINFWDIRKVEITSKWVWSSIGWCSFMCRCNSLSLLMEKLQCRHWWADLVEWKTKWSCITSSVLAWKPQNGQRYRESCSNVDCCIPGLIDEPLDFGFWLWPGISSPMVCLCRHWKQMMKTYCEEEIYYSMSSAASYFNINDDMVTIEKLIIHFKSMSKH